MFTDNNQNSVTNEVSSFAPFSFGARWAVWPLAVALAVHAGVYAQPAPTEDPTGNKGQAALKEIEDETGYAISVQVDPITGTPTLIEAEVLHLAKPDQKASDEARTETAREFLNRFRDVLGIDEPDAELTVASAEAGDLGRRHVRFAQTYEGLPVWPAEIRVHLDSFGDVTAANGKYIRTPRRLNTKPAIDAARAEAMGREVVPGDGEAIELGPDLIIFASPEGNSPRLAWKLAFDVSLASHWTIVIDANSGEVLMAFDAVCSANNPGGGTDEFGIQRSLNVWAANGGYLLYDTSKPMFDPATGSGSIGVFDGRNTTQGGWEIESSDPYWWTPPAAVGAAFNLSETYDYYFERHGRDSYDNRGGDIGAIVRFLFPEGPNAAWNSQNKVMLFDDRVPFASVLDVVAHELTHAVTDESSDLIYQGQSGALNESMSDIFGEMVEARTYGRNDWLMAAELEPYGLGPMRSLSDPNSISTRFGPYPARMSQYVDTPDDNGGVHINSSIINHAFYLLAEGLSGAIGLDAAAQIFYRANTVYLTPSAQFSDARELVIQSADDIFGPSSVQSRVTAEAFDAVEIFGDNPPPPPPGDDEFEENDSLSSAAGISGGTLSLRGKDDDWFRVRVGPGRMTIRVSGPEGDLDLAVTDLNGNLLGASTSTSSVETISREETQTVERLILVHPYGGASSDYQLTVDVPPGCEGGCDDTGGGLCGNGCAMAMFASFAGLLGFSGIERRRVRT